MQAHSGQRDNVGFFMDGGIMVDFYFYLYAFSPLASFSTMPV